MDGVGTPIIGRPRPLPGHDTPNPAYHPHTLNYEEPLNADKTWQISGENADQCFLPHDKKYWTVARYPDSGAVYFVQSDTKDSGIYDGTTSEIRLSEDKRTVTFVPGAYFYKFTITK